MGKQSEIAEAFSLFNLIKLSKASGIQYDRLYNVLKGNREEGFTQEERALLTRVIKLEMNKAVAFLGTPVKA